MVVKMEILMKGTDQKLTLLGDSFIPTASLNQTFDSKSVGVFTIEGIDRRIALRIQDILAITQEEVKE